MWFRIADKWATGKFEEVPCQIAGQEVMLKQEICEAGFGDLIGEYVRILNTPWWRRGLGWGFAKEFLRDRLNIITLGWHK